MNRLPRNCHAPVWPVQAIALEVAAHDRVGVFDRIGGVAGELQPEVRPERLAEPNLAGHCETRVPPTGNRSTVTRLAVRAGGHVDQLVEPLRIVVARLGLLAESPLARRGQIVDLVKKTCRCDCSSATYKPAIGVEAEAHDLAQIANRLGQLACPLAGSSTTTRRLAFDNPQPAPAIDGHRARACSTANSPSFSPDGLVVFHHATWRGGRRPAAHCR